MPKPRKKTGVLPKKTRKAAQPPKPTASDLKRMALIRSALAAVRKVEAATLKRAATSPRNRILRQAVPETVRTAIARVKARSLARKQQFDAALRKARITKRDHGRTVIFDTSGKRWPDFQSVPAQIKVFMLMVGPKGGRRLVNPQDPDTIMRGSPGQPLPMTRKDFSFEKLVRIAPKKFREVAAGMEQAGRKAERKKPLTREQLQAEIERTAPVDVGRNGDIEVFYRKATEAYVAKVRDFLELTRWGFDILLDVQGQEKVLRVATQELSAYKFFKVVPVGRTGRKIVYRNNSTSPKALRWSVKAMTNEVIRAELRVRGLVSQGSASRISRLPFNKGLAKTKWKDKNGAHWRGANLTPVRIRRIQFRLFRVV